MTAPQTCSLCEHALEGKVHQCVLCDDFVVCPDCFRDRVREHEHHASAFDMLSQPASSSSSPTRRAPVSADMDALLEMELDLLLADDLDGFKLKTDNPVSDEQVPLAPQTPPPEPSEAAPLQAASLPTEHLGALVAPAAVTTTDVQAEQQVEGSFSTSPTAVQDTTQPDPVGLSAWSSVDESSLCPSACRECSLCLSAVHEHMFGQSATERSMESTVQPKEQQYVENWTEDDCCKEINVFRRQGKLGLVLGHRVGSDGVLVCVERSEYFPSFDVS